MVNVGVKDKKKLSITKVLKKVTKRQDNSLQKQAKAPQSNQACSKKANVAVSGHKTPSKLKTPRKAAETPTKSPQKEANRDALVETHKRGLKKQEENSQLREDEDHEVVVKKKAKQTSKRKKSATPVPVEVEYESADEAEGIKDEEMGETHLSLCETNISENEDEGDDDEKKAVDCKNNAASVSKLNGKEELTGMLKVKVENIGSASVSSLKEYFQDCGEIIRCTICKEGDAHVALITLKGLSEAKCAAENKNKTHFEGQTINVEVRTFRLFSPEDTVILTNFIRIESTFGKQIRNIKTEMSKLFGNISAAKFQRYDCSIAIQFEEKSSAAKALKAKTFNFMGCDVLVNAFRAISHVLLVGVTSELEEEDIRTAMSVHCTVVSTTIPTDQVTGIRRTYAIVDFAGREDVDKLLAMETIQIKNVVLDILPYKYFNPKTGIFYRHPTSILVENLNKKKFSKTNETHLWKFFARFGAIDDIQYFGYSKIAFVRYFDKVSVEKALKSNTYEIDNMKVKVHAVDGVYRPGYDCNVSNAVYISNIPEESYIKEVIENIKLIGQYIQKDVVFDRLTKKFKNAIILKFESEQLAQKVLDAKIQLANKTVLVQEIYQPDKHNVIDKSIVLVKNIDKSTNEVDLWKSFHTFGEIVKTVVLRDRNQVSIRWGYIQFATADIVREALKASIYINGIKTCLMKPSHEVVDKIFTATQSTGSGEDSGDQSRE